MTPPQTCRFQNGKDRCATHFDLIAGRRGEHYAALCDIGLAALRAEVEALRAQFKNTGQVPYLDRMKELANRLDEQATVIGRLRGALTKAIELLDEVKAQWGEDYLWKKWEMDVELAEVKALSPEPKEA